MRSRFSTLVLRSSKPVSTIVAGSKSGVSGSASVK